MITLLALAACSWMSAPAPSEALAARLGPIRRGPTLSAPAELQRGWPAEVVGAGFQPGASAWLLGSARVGPADCPARVAPDCLDLAAPWHVLAMVSVDAAGVATFRVAVPEGLAGRRVELQAVAREASSGAATAGQWVDVVSPVCASAAGLPSVPVRQLFRDDQLATQMDTAAFDPLPGADGVRTVSDAAGYAALQAELGLTLGPVDFTRERVVVAWHVRSSTCGMDLLSAVGHQQASGVVQLDVVLEDASLGCCIVCDAFGMVAAGWAVPATGPVPVCEVWTGGCGEPSCDSGLP